MRAIADFEYPPDWVWAAHHPVALLVMVLVAAFVTLFVAILMDS